ncbi:MULTISPECIES: TetR family transcriptional regulator [unclassified Amycolatopsis]|uniref:TetR/AcrR family transcriptional regulator n=1 Tax=unclassified Amycolatopsis TaxID=2618356 RepID=UPI002875E78E|nr:MULTISPECIES: TetR family transcriptional regulator [unclassified Amycolatopsis]MDS0133393.1 TetR/AcrR family transcriptional regulator [Amycolatopsis sp. 505]MDS0146623.1 TetR/AcrR family transcriptional regulator [Amycolatopsis sp. CM201R]
MTSFTERTKASLREALLDAAADLLPDRGHAGLRMADVAAKAGVSRQTVYNEFGNKAALTQAVALRTASEFLDGIRQRFETADGLLAGIHHAVVYTIEHARENRLVAAALGTEAGEDLLPLLTTRGEPILTAAADLAAEQYREFEPGLSAEAAALLAETVVRLSLSHLVLSTHSATEAAGAVTAVLEPAIRQFVHNGVKR